MGWVQVSPSVFVLEAKLKWLQLPRPCSCRVGHLSEGKRSARYLDGLCLYQVDSHSIGQSKPYSPARSGAKEASGVSGYLPNIPAHHSSEYGNSGLP